MAESIYSVMCSWAKVLISDSEMKSGFGRKYHPLMLTRTWRSNTHLHKPDSGSSPNRATAGIQICWEHHWKGVVYTRDWEASWLRTLVSGNRGHRPQCLNDFKFSVQFVSWICPLPQPPIDTSSQLKMWMERYGPQYSFRAMSDPESMRVPECRQNATESGSPRERKHIDQREGTFYQNDQQKLKESRQAKWSHFKDK